VEKQCRRPPARAALSQRVLQQRLSLGAVITEQQPQWQLACVALQPAWPPHAAGAHSASEDGCVEQQWVSG